MGGAFAEANTEVRGLWDGRGPWDVYEKVRGLGWALAVEEYY